MASIRVVVEYIVHNDGSIGYAGGRFCYHTDALIDIAVPDGTTPVQALIYDLHQPDEMIRITFMQSRHRRQVSPDVADDVPEKTDDDNRAHIAASRRKG